MDSKKILKAFGRCYNRKDFSVIESLLSDNVVYESYDCIYRVTSAEDVLKVINQSIKGATYAFSGFYLYKGILLKHLTECVLICDAESLRCIRIIRIKLKKGKIVNITGYNPNKYKYTRGKKIEG